MRKTNIVTTFSSGILFAVTIFGFSLDCGTCFYKWSKTQNRFDFVEVGDTKEILIEKMGLPSYTEMPEDSFHRYADKKCQNCAQRWWYEYRNCLDLKAWSIDFDENMKVIKKGSWISP